jgi:hypothetical protein
MVHRTIAIGIAFRAEFEMENLEKPTYDTQRMLKSLAKPATEMTGLFACRTSHDQRLCSSRHFLTTASAFSICFSALESA